MGILCGGMLVWINGPFGGGKTATACELNRRVPGSVVCSPEHVGYGMRRMLPDGLRGNFQDLPPWRRSVVELLRLTLRDYDGPVIVPMTLVNPEYFREIIGGLRGDGFALHHFTLLAEPATVRRRLGQRSLGTESRPGSWAMQHLDEHLERLRAPEFAQHVHTDRRTVAQVAEVISGAAGLAIMPSTDGPVRAWLRRYATTIRHIRLRA
jgi:AAA domain